jgi:hypothetical protein
VIIPFIIMAIGFFLLFEKADENIVFACLVVATIRYIKKPIKLKQKRQQPNPELELLISFSQYLLDKISMLVMLK